MTPEQLSFPQPHQVSYASRDYHEGDANALARAMLSRPDGWPQGKLVLVGDEGAGKTHLAHIWAEVHRAKLMTDATLARRAPGPVVVDGADLVAGDAEKEETLFHLHNNLASEGYPLLMTAKNPPTSWSVALPDLRSRMEATTIARIEPPDDETLAAIVGKLMHDRQLNPAPGLAAYLTKRMARSYADAGRIVAALDTLALREQRAITTTLAARVLDAEPD